MSPPFRVLVLSLLTLPLSCSAPPQRSPEAELVPCLFNDVANTVLKNIIDRCASSHGEWSHDMGPGCPRIWATQFGFAAGLRRQRDDLVALATVTAARQNSDLNKLIWDAIFGGADAEDGEPGPEVYGVPALFVSGILNRSGNHYAKFRLAFDRALGELNFDSLGDTRLTGLVVLLAEIARTELDERDKLLARARGLAEKIPGPKFRAYAWSTIAKASTSAEDIKTARAAVEDATPQFRFEDGKVVFDPAEEYVLSRYLALVAALADMTQLENSPNDRLRAERLLAFVFSKRLFNGSVLAHDGARNGYLSDEYCSGCNLNALYLVDRLYGDTFKIAPLPELPERPDPWIETVTKDEELFRLRPGPPGTAFLDWEALSVGYTEVAPSDDHPHGALKLDFRLTDSLEDCRFERRGERAVVVPLDANGQASYTLTGDSVVEGEYDADKARFTFELGASVNGARVMRLVSVRRKRP